MDSNSPNYAKWIPEAGGYVHNGSVISKTPIYGENGLQEVDVDVSRLAPQQETQPTIQTGNVDTYDFTKGVGGAFAKSGLMENQAGSGEDVNSVMTQANSLNSLSENTANTGYGPLNTPATHSNIAGEPILSPLEQAQKDYEYMVSTGNLKGQIDQLTKIGLLTNTDNSQAIKQLTEQRNQKIQNQDALYSQQYADAYAMGDYERAAQIQQEQQAYRNKVGYQDVIQSEYEMKQQELQLNFEDAYKQGLTDIANMVMSTASGLLNFQYNPQTDMALQAAQSSAIGAVKEQMNHTGMYYSSMTQSAITRAAAELVPVYEKMAKDEIKEKLSMLMNVGNYLMNMEQTQFNMWKGQLEMQWQANNERRKEYQAALDRTNAWGYVSNEDAAILNVAPGTLSPQAMAEARALQKEIDKENRTLQQNMIMADYNNAFTLEKMKLQSELDDWEDAQKQARNYQYDSMLSAQNYRQQASLKAMSGGGGSGGSSGSGLASLLNNSGFSSETVSGLSELISSDASVSDVKKFLTNNKKSISQMDDTAEAIIDVLAKQELEELAKNDPTLRQIISTPTGMKNKLATVKNDIIQQQNDTLLAAYVTDGILPKIDEAIGNNFGSDSGKTKEALQNALTIADEYTTGLLSDLNYVSKDQEIEAVYQHIIDKINSANNFDYSWWNMLDNYNQERVNAEEYIVNEIKENNKFGKSTNKIANNIQSYIDNLKSNNMSNGQWKTEDYRNDWITNTNRELDSALKGTVSSINNTLNNTTFKDVASGIGNAVNPLMNPTTPTGIVMNASNIISNIASGINKNKKEG